MLLCHDSLLSLKLVFQAQVHLSVFLKQAERFPGIMITVNIHNAEFGSKVCTIGKVNLGFYGIAMLLEIIQKQELRDYAFVVILGIDQEAEILLRLVDAPGVNPVTIVRSGTRRSRDLAHLLIKIERCVH
jgi:hypothetical protein